MKQTNDTVDAPTKHPQPARNHHVQENSYHRHISGACRRDGARDAWYGLKRNDISAAVTSSGIPVITNRTMRYYRPYYGYHVSTVRTTAIRATTVRITVALLRLSRATSAHIPPMATTRNCGYTWCD